MALSIQRRDYGFDEFFLHIDAIIQGRRSYEIERQHGWETPHPVLTFVLSHEIPEKTTKRSDVVFTNEDIAEVLDRYYDDITVEQVESHQEDGIGSRTDPCFGSDIDSLPV